MRTTAEIPPARTRSIRPSTHVSAACIALGSASFVVAWILAFLAAPDLLFFYYQPRVLAVVHTFTLGWISLTMIGVLYQYVPALVKRPVTWPRAVGLQAALFSLGTMGMIAHFWTGHLAGMAWSAGVVAASVLLFAAQLIPGLLRAPLFDATVIGVLAGVGYFASTALLGFLYALDKVHPFLGGTVLSNVAAHAHVALLGWVSMTICAVSYRVVAAFLLPGTPLPQSARWQILSLAALVPLLLIALLERSPLAGAVALLIVASFAWYAVILGRLTATRRMPIDWTLRHVIAALLHLAAAALLAGMLFFVDPGSATGSRLVLTYGLLVLVGWISNYIVGIGIRMAPGLMGLGAAPLLSERRRATLFWLLNGGIAAVAASLLTGDVFAFRASTLFPLAAALLFIGSLVARLSRSRRRA